MRLEQLKYILALEECKSINKAAKKLYIAPQTLCAALNALEDELGFSIFTRTSKGVSSTYRGQMIMDDVKGIIKIINKWQNITRGENEEVGEIRIATANVCAPILTKIIAEMKKVYPNTVIFLNTLNPNAVLWKREVTLEADIVLLPIPLEHKDYMYDVIMGKGCVIIELGYDMEYLVMGSDNALIQEDEVGIEDLYNQELAVYRISDDDVFSGEEIAKYFKQGISYVFNDKEQLRRIVAKNHAVTLGLNLDGYDNYYFQSGKLFMRPIKEYGKKFVYTLSHPNKVRRSAAEEFILDKITNTFLQLQVDKIIT